MENIIFVSPDPLVLQQWAKGVTAHYTVDTIEALKPLMDQPRIIFLDANVCSIEETVTLAQTYPLAKMVVLTSEPSFDEGRALLRAPIAGYGNTYMHPQNLSLIVDVVASGQIWLYPQFIQMLIQGIPTAKKTSDDKWMLLTDKEQEVSRLVALGLSNKEIASKLGVTQSTIKAHLSHTYAKLHLFDRLSLALWVKESV